MVKKQWSVGRIEPTTTRLRGNLAYHQTTYPRPVSQCHPIEIAQLFVHSLVPAKINWDERERIVDGVSSEIRIA